MESVYVTVNLQKLCFLSVFIASFKHPEITKRKKSAIRNELCMLSIKFMRWNLKVSQICAKKKMKKKSRSQSESGKNPKMTNSREQRQRIVLSNIKAYTNKANETNKIRKKAERKITIISSFYASLIYCSYFLGGNATLNRFN